MRSQRLEFERLTPQLVPNFLELARDLHILRYLLDGEIMPDEWGPQELRASDELFKSLSIGIWLLKEQSGQYIGFCGFKIFAEMSPEPQLLYAFVESATGCGLATECARKLLEKVPMETVLAAVDEPNVASIRVLEKVGFRKLEKTMPGAFGETFFFQFSK